MLKMIFFIFNVRIININIESLCMNLKLNDKNKVLSQANKLFNWYHTNINKTIIAFYNMHLKLYALF